MYNSAVGPEGRDVSDRGGSVWLHTPFLRHPFEISAQSEIDTLRVSGVGQVTIETEQGLDFAFPEINPADPAPALENSPGPPMSNQAMTQLRREGIDVESILRQEAA